MTSPRSGIRLDFATLISTSIECILYGISLVFFGGTVWALTHGRPRDEKINWSLALVALILMTLSSVHMVVDIRRLVLGFITKANFYPGDPTGFFADVTQRTFIIKNTVYILQTLLGDGVMIYRCYVVWQCLEVIILPAMLWCATSAISAGLLYQLLHATNSNVFLLDTGRWAALFYLLTITTNIVSSGLLVFRIWATNRDRPGMVRVLSRSMVDAMLLLRILVDSAALYTITLFALLMCYAYQNTWEFIVLDMVTPIISITFYMVLVRIAIARNGSVHLPVAVLSPLRFAVRAIPSPSEARVVGARRSSI